VAFIDELSVKIYLISNKDPEILSTEEILWVFDISCCVQIPESLKSYAGAAIVDRL
jgi:hypothetical protein